MLLIRCVSRAKCGELVANYSGAGSVVGYTVLHQGSGPWRAVAVFDLPDGQRTVAYSEDPAMMEVMMTQECCGMSYYVSAGRFQ